MVWYRQHLSLRFAFTGSRCNPADCVQSVDKLHLTCRVRSLSLQPEPLDITGWVRRRGVLDLLDLGVAELGNEEVRCGEIAEEVVANGRCLHNVVLRDTGAGSLAGCVVQ